MDSLHGITKGTEFEPFIKAAAQAEANGTMMYYALARLAEEQGLPEVAATFIEAANQEAVHAGFYATLNGAYPKDFWEFVRNVRNLEIKGEAKVKALADKVRESGLQEAADVMEIFARQEGNHGVMLDELLKKYHPVNEEPKPGEKVYVCEICGYEYRGDLDKEGEDFRCPLCGQPKNAFKEKI